MFAPRPSCVGPWLVLSSSILACGGKVVFDSEGSGGSGGSGGASISATSVTSGASSTSGPGSSVASSGVGGSAACAGLGEVDCLGAFPDCVPAYDDACCPSCDPGPCADCVNVVFAECRPLSTACSGQVSCGFTPPWACEGGVAECPDGQRCNFQPGCVELTCAEGEPCPGTILCAPVTASLCTPPPCDAVPPACPPGSFPEATNDCYTGFCVVDQGRCKSGG